jgi:phytoene/squalene synthetase
MDANPASAITKAASKQTYYTVRFLVDRDRVDDAYRSYAYFRWVDDVLDSNADPEPARNKCDADRRRSFLERQKSLLDSCYRGDPTREMSVEENMLVELVSRDRGKNSPLQSYLRNMMSVMEFDAWRRGALISQAELDKYTRWLAVAVTDNMRYFIGHGSYTPMDDTRYLAVSAAHIAHMIRDTYDDVRAGYYNIPREVLAAHRIGPQEVQSDAYRDWVKGRVRLAREYFKAGKVYFRRVRSLRHRLAGFAYMARFEWLLDTIEKENFVLRPHYHERKSMRSGIRMSWMALNSIVDFGAAGPVSRSAVSQGRGKA